MHSRSRWLFRGDRQVCEHRDNRLSVETGRSSLSELSDPGSPRATKTTDYQRHTCGERNWHLKSSCYWANGGNLTAVSLQQSSSDRRCSLANQADRWFRGTIAPIFKLIERNLGRRGPGSGAALPLLRHSHRRPRHRRDLLPTARRMRRTHSISFDALMKPRPQPRLEGPGLR